MALCIGHSIVPGTVPVGTLLYHGRRDKKMPTIPEWTATDPEHSYHFCGGSSVNDTSSAGGCWHLTIVTTRPLNVLYLDGSSAANMKDGTLDAQDLLVWGKVDPARWMEERTRINDLCAWGKEFGIDGYFRCVFRSNSVIGYSLNHFLEDGNGLVSNIEIIARAWSSGLTARSCSATSRTGLSSFRLIFLPLGGRAPSHRLCGSPGNSPKVMI